MGPFSAGPVEPGSGSFWDSGFRPPWGSKQTNNDLSLAGVSLISPQPYVDTKGYVVPVVTVVQNDQSPMGPPPKPAQKKVRNFSRQLPLRRDYETDTQMPDAPQEALANPPSEQFHMAPLQQTAEVESYDMFNILSPFNVTFPKNKISDTPLAGPVMTPRSEEFHMTPIQPTGAEQSYDTFNILSPIATEFPKVEFPSVSEEPSMSPRATEFHMTPLKPPAAVQSHDSFNILSPLTNEFFLNDNMPKSVSNLPPPRPTRAAPPPPPREHPMETFDSIFSPTTGSFPLLQPIQILPLRSEEPSFGSKTAVRNDSLYPEPSPYYTVTQFPSPNRRLRTKFSAPNLSQCIKLKKIQTEIAKTLPKRPSEAEEVLMSPRATEFVANPFHTFGEPTKEEAALAARRVQINTQVLPQVLEAKGNSNSVSPTVSESDPRSPAQLGISPITRNIFGML
jgi:tyrosine-protein phosphatase MSG5